MKGHEDKRSETFLFLVIGKNVGLVDFALNVTEKIPPSRFLQ
jgi:hypothetical protein